MVRLGLSIASPRNKDCDGRFQPSAEVDRKPTAADKTVRSNFSFLATRGLINKTSRFEANSSLSNSRQLCKNKMDTSEDIWRITQGDFHR